MKKKLFAFALTGVVFGFCTTNSNLYAGIQQAKDGNNFSPATQKLQLPNDFNAVLGHSESNVDRVCGDYDQLLSLAGVCTPPASIAGELSEDVSEPAMVEQSLAEGSTSERPPTLKPPSNPTSDMVARLELMVKRQLSIVSQSLWNHSLGQVQESILRYTPLAIRNYRSYRDRLESLVVDQIASMANSFVRSSPSIMPAVDPIRSRALLEEYQPYDLAFHDRLWIERMHHQYRSIEPTSEDLAILDSFMAASEAMCSPSQKLEYHASVDPVEIVPLASLNKGPAYFIRKIPVDYSFETMTPMTTPLPSYPALNSIVDAKPSMLPAEDLRDMFGQHIIPVVDFHTTGLHYLNRQPKFVWSNLGSYPKFNVAPSIPAVASDARSGLIDRGWRTAAAQGVHVAKKSLAQMQSWLDQLEFALAIDSDAAKIAVTEHANEK